MAGQLALALGLAYVAGSFPTAWLVGRARGIDLRTAGSGNYGATNVYRTLGAVPAIVALVGDVAKGLLPVLLLPRWIPVPELELPTYGVLLALAAIVGHVFSLFLRFRGGKGVGTTFGAYLALAPWATLAAALVWLALVRWRRLVSLASLAAASVLLVAVVVSQATTWPEGWPLVAATGALVAFVFWTHRENLSRLRRGTEQPIVAGGGERQLGGRG
ncbi:MAG: glycerol-3-phosphate 1-O-acyltransferase PlsY [Gemmatimonadota bacterium]